MLCLPYGSQIPVDGVLSVRLFVHVHTLHTVSLSDIVGSCIWLGGAVVSAVGGAVGGAVGSAVVDDSLLHCCSNILQCMSCSVTVELCSCKKYVTKQSIE